MKNIQVEIYKAFSEVASGGSAAGIVADAQQLDENSMQTIARCVGAPATGFITSINDEQIEVRFFSTQTEYPMCGHGTIALVTQLIESKQIQFNEEPVKQLRLQTPFGAADMTAQMGNDDRPRIYIDLQPAPFDSCASTATELANLLSLHANDFDSQSPIEITRSDFTHIVARVRGLQQMKSIQPNLAAIKDYCHDHDAHTLALFCTETESGDANIHVREFCPAVGTDEAPASGTTNRALACYLHRHRLISAAQSGSTTIVAEQGYELGSPSHITAVVSTRGDRIEKVAIGGVATRAEARNIEY